MFLLEKFGEDYFYYFFIIIISPFLQNVYFQFQKLYHNDLPARSCFETKRS